MLAMPPDPDLTVRDAAVTRRVGRLRLLAGLAQGGLLVWLYQAQQGNAWPAGLPGLYFTLVLGALILPVLLISGLGHLARRQLLAWLGAAALAVAAFALHDAWRSTLPPAVASPLPRQPAPLVFLACVAFFCIAHSLVLAGAHDRRRVAHYATCFEYAWKLCVQVLFSLMFVAGFWLVLWMGASLFELLKLGFLRNLLQQSWFSVPVLCAAFSSAMHVTDVRPVIVRSIRTLLLVLMAWILPLAAVLAAAFLASLPFTGAEVLWQTKRATAVLLATCAVLVVLVNAAFQSGDTAAVLARTVRAAARLACLLLLPLALLGIYALALRVREYGWASERVVAGACLLVALFYAGGYGYAAVRRGVPWLDGLRYVNVAAAFMVLGVLLALFTPLADPARIAVQDQVARLARGQVDAARFDYNFLRFHAARYGVQALQTLQREGVGPQAAAVRERAGAAMTRKYDSPQAEVLDAEIAANLQAWPKGTMLPEGLVRQDWTLAARDTMLPHCLTRAGVRCDAFALDMDGDGKQEVLVVGQERYVGAVLLGEAGGQWSVLARLPFDAAGCQPLLERLRAGDFTLVPSMARDIEVAGQRIPLQREVPLPAGLCAALGKP